MAKKHYTFVMEEEENRNIEICAAIEGKQKSEIVKAALTLYFAEREYKSVFDLHPTRNKNSKPQNKLAKAA